MNVAFPSIWNMLASGIALLVGWYYIQKYMRTWLSYENNMVAMTLASILSMSAGVMTDMVIGSEPEEVDDYKVCSMEAKICPDGSASVRQGVNCQFSPCPKKAG